MKAYYVIQGMKLIHECVQLKNIARILTHEQIYKTVDNILPKHQLGYGDGCSSQQLEILTKGEM